MEIVWYTAMSMDGRIATAGESLDFLDTIAEGEAAHGGFESFYASVDAIVVGAGTLRWLVRGGHGWPHGEKPTWVVTHDAALVAGLGETAAPLRRAEGDLRAVVDAIEASGARRVWLAGGGSVAGQLLALDRVDEVLVTIAPVALGAGPPLFGERALDLRVFEVAESRVIGGNAVSIRWRRKREAPGA